MRLLSLLEDERKSGAIWYVLFRQSPYLATPYSSVEISLASGLTQVHNYLTLACDDRQARSPNGDQICRCHVGCSGGSGRRLSRCGDASGLRGFHGDNGRSHRRETMRRTVDLSGTSKRTRVSASAG
jgi:hypothetical protein